MNKLLGASFLLVILTLLSTKAFASSLNCKLQDPDSMIAIKSIQLNDQYLFINNAMEIPLSKTQVRCGNFGRQVRFDGMALGYQVVLESCTTEAELKGVLVDYLRKTVADIQCE